MNPNKIQLENPPNIPLGDEFENIRVDGAGGIARDLARRELLGHEVTIDDIDIVATESEPETFIEQGFKPVNGSSFPVFIDSENREVALARTEQKMDVDEQSGDVSAHTAFTAFAIEPEVPRMEALEIDSARRDLTINAMFLDFQTGEIIDFHNGIEDLRNGIIRHVTEAFAEDPIRVLRAARFAARMEFDVHPETKELMEEVAPELHDVPGERIEKELFKMFRQAKEPRRFFDVLDSVNALEIAFPEIASLQTVPAGPEEHHQEGSAYEHTMRVLSEMQSRLPNNEDALFAALMHDVGKSITKNDRLPNHPVHHKRGVMVADWMRSRLGLSNHRSKVAEDAIRHHMKLHDIQKLNATTVLDMSHAISLPKRVLVALAESDSAGRVPQSEAASDAIRSRLSRAESVLDSVGGVEAVARRNDVSDASEAADVLDGLEGDVIRNMIRQDRVEEFRRRERDEVVDEPVSVPSV